MSNDLKQFWLRRAKRLLPALFTLLVVTCTYAALFVPDALYRLRHDVLAALTYSTNWWLIASHQSYFDALGRPPLLRHLWSLAVEEQWYLLWPLVFVTAMGLVRDRAERLVLPIVLAAAASSVWMAVVFDPSADASRAYFGTDTRISGLLLGAAAAMIWSPWRWARAGRRHLAGLDGFGWAALLVLVGVMLQWGDDTAFLYRGGFFLVAVLSLVVVAAAVHPGAMTLRSFLALPPLRYLGSRSYGLYLWHWPVFMVMRHQDYPWMDQRLRVTLEFAITLAITELSLRLVEMPVRDGSAMRRLDAWRADGDLRARARGWVVVGTTTAVLSVGFVGGRIATADPVDVATGGKAATFDASSFAALAPVAARATPGTLPESLPRRIVVVGDSQANALVKNAPSGLGATLQLANGSVEGCGLIDVGQIRTTAHFRRAFGDCQGWEHKWAASARAARAQVALVVLGAWDMFDIQRDNGVLAFGTPADDAYLLAQLRRGVDALVGAGSKVALLEIPCYRPVDGGGLIALPERGDDHRTAHLNQLLRQTAAGDPAHVVFVTGPRDWCHDAAIATDLAYRWDGVHYYRPGAKLVFNTITPELVAIPVA
jgi:peptidoglycan/LPS O-acetylase OafA/YrhL